jgi:hypothetical protein
MSVTVINEGWGLSGFSADNNAQLSNVTTNRDEFKSYKVLQLPLPGDEPKYVPIEPTQFGKIAEEKPLHKTKKAAQQKNEEESEPVLKKTKKERILSVNPNNFKETRKFLSQLMKRNDGYDEDQANIGL